MTNTKEIFDFLLKGKFITFSHDNQLPSKDELRGKMYYKFQTSWNHNTNYCWSFRNIIQDRINKGILKFPEKKEAMVIDEDPFSPIASINIDATGLRVLLNAKKAKRFSLSAKIRKIWIPKQYLVYMDDLVVRRRVSATRKRKKNRRYSYHSFEEIKKKKFSKRNDVFPKERHAFLRKKKGINDLSRRKMPPRFVIPFLVSLGQE